MLWRIRDCEELLKSRVSTQELGDQIKAVEARCRVKQEVEVEKLNEQLRKQREEALQRIKTIENFVTDKIADSKEFIKNLELKVAFSA